VLLHGDDFAEGVEERIERRLAEAPGSVRILRVDSELTLGEVLNQGVEAALGTYVTKMDDDDYYSVDHLWDLVLAIEYAGADLAGKAAEFVYLEEIDVTIRQLTKDVETRLAGGGMMMRRDSLRDAGGWPSLTRGEDLAIVRRFVGQERTVHRTAPHGYILNRHGRDHTWRPYVDYFLFRSGRQWRGLRFDQTGFE
ncbi:MAG TPA: glycosyltransferase, partial [Thermoleophilaceae bacterium]|nr:glycosyltransferase [Thermoleophilaceae bacterium]